MRVLAPTITPPASDPTNPMPTKRPTTRDHTSSSADTPGMSRKPFVSGTTGPSSTSYTRMSTSCPGAGHTAATQRDP